MTLLRNVTLQGPVVYLYEIQTPNIDIYFILCKVLNQYLAHPI